MRDTRNPGSGECHDPLWELIPWYVNGSMPPEQTEAIKRHGTSCTTCAAEIERQRRLAKGVVLVDPFEAPLSQSWEHLRAQIEAEDRARSPRAGTWRRFRGLQGGLFLAGTFAAVCLIVVGAIWPFDDGFKTLTSEAEHMTYVIKFQAAPEVNEERLIRLLAEHGVALVTGPSEAGVYTAVAPAGTDLEAAAKALMATSEVMFAAPEAGQ